MKNFRNLWGRIAWAGRRQRVDRRPRGVDLQHDGSPGRGRRRVHGRVHPALVGADAQGRVPAARQPELRLRLCCRRRATTSTRSRPATTSTSASCRRLWTASDAEAESMPGGGIEHFFFGALANQAFMGARARSPLRAARARRGDPDGQRRAAGHHRLRLPGVALLERLRRRAQHRRRDHRAGSHAADRARRRGHRAACSSILPGAQAHPRPRPRPRQPGGARPHGPASRGGARDQQPRAGLHGERAGRRREGERLPVRRPRDRPRGAHGRQLRAPHPPARADADLDPERTARDARLGGGRRARQRPGADQPPRARAHDHDPGHAARPSCRWKRRWSASTPRSCSRCATETGSAASTASTTRAAPTS